MIRAIWLRQAGKPKTHSIVVVDTLPVEPHCRDDYVIPNQTLYDPPCFVALRCAEARSAVATRPNDPKPFVPVIHCLVTTTTALPSGKT